MINLKDVLAIQKHVADKAALSGKAFLAADVDENKTVDIKDALMLQKFVAKLLTAGTHRIGEKLTSQ